MKSEKSKEELKRFWDIRSKSFPGHRDGDTYQAKILAIMQEHGVDLHNKQVLDLGCGSGAYTLRMAQQAKAVTALDVSEGMLKALRNSAKAGNISNIQYVQSDWMDYESDEIFDVIICSLTPALNSKEALDKIRKYAGRWVVYIGFAGPMQAYVLEGLFALYGVKRRHENFGPVIREWLHDNSVAHTVYFVKNEWVTEQKYEDMLNNCFDVLTAHEIQPDMEAVEAYIQQFKNQKSGMYVSKTAYDIEMLIWDNSRLVFQHKNNCPA